MESPKRPFYTFLTLVFVVLNQCACQGGVRLVKSELKYTMRKTLVLFLLAIAPATVHAQTKLNLVPSESKLTWRGFVKLTFGAGHHGVIEGITGTVTTGPDGKIQNGDFTLDMNTIRAVDQKEERGNKDLSDHLKGDDFFSVAAFPTGHFSIISVTYENSTDATLEGFLGLKGITNKIKFPVKIEAQEKSIRARGTVTIDRTKWNVNYQSASLFGNLKDSTLSDQVVIELDLRFR